MPGRGLAFPKRRRFWMKPNQAESYTLLYLRLSAIEAKQLFNALQNETLRDLSDLCGSIKKQIHCQYPIKSFWAIVIVWIKPDHKESRMPFRNAGHGVGGLLHR